MQMVRVLFVLTATVLVGLGDVWANMVSPQFAQTLARNFVEANIKRSARDEFRADNMALAFTATVEQIPNRQQAQRRGRIADTTVLFYVFNINEADNAGFVIVSADSVVRPILGFSQGRNFVRDSINPNFEFWLNFLKEQVTFALESNIGQSDFVRKEWENASEKNNLRQNFTEPLIATQWGQSEPFNDSTPFDGDIRSVAGCVAIAMTQIMNFHLWPPKGRGESKKYTSQSGMLMLPVGFGVYYAWHNMLKSYDYYLDEHRSWQMLATEEQRNAVAQLVLHAGISVKMNYSATASGAYSSNVSGALIEHFAYSKKITLKSRVNYTNATWEKMLREQIFAGLPVYYSGRTPKEYGDIGHAFILDGATDDGLFHFNWGWYGNHNGWFLTTALDPEGYGTGGGEGGFNRLQSAIIDIIPDTALFPKANVSILGDNKKNNSQEFGIILSQTVVSDSLQIYIVLPSEMEIVKFQVRIFDMTGSLVWANTSESLAQRTLTWDLRNSSGRYVASGTYLVVAEATSACGKKNYYRTQIGVRR